jgi:pSer/pThr/pTyr-binding forkhead associated (FHA) protein
LSCLVVLSGSAKGRTYQVSPERDNVVGRIGECSICIVDPRMSRRHCLIAAGSTGYSIRDLGSANGIFLNNVKVKEALLKDTDKVRMGSTELEFHLTERFEDAETKRVKPGDQAPPDLQPSRKRKSARKLDTEALVEFCSRCEGSIPASEFTTGKAQRIAGKPVCVECIARDIAVQDAAKVADSASNLPEAATRDPREDSRERTSAEEVSELAAEVAQEAEEKEQSAAAEAMPVPVEEDDEFSTDALLIGDGAFDDDNDDDAPESAPQTGHDTPTAEAQPAPQTKPSAPTVLRSAEEITGLPANAENFDNAPLEPEEVVDLDDDDLPKLPDEGEGGFSENAKTPRPGSQIRVL